MRALQAALALLIICLCLPAFGQTYDVVIRGGRVLDPETGLDAVRDVGISGGKIDRFRGSAPSKLVAWLSPRDSSTIDLHQHGQDPDSQRLKALDGVTTALELEIGAPDVTAFLEAHQGKSLINYGLSASHAAARAAAFGSPMPGNEIIPKSGPATNNPATAEQFKAIESRLEHEIAAGALGVGMGLQYTPGATRF